MNRSTVGIAAVGVVVAAVVLAGGVALTRTFMVPAAVAMDSSLVPPPPVDPNLVAQHLAQAIRFQTVSGGDVKEADRDAAIEELYLAFERMYPYFHEQAPQQAYGAGHVFVWRGTDSNLPPILIMAHLDVAPVAEGTEKEWTHAPFSGDIADGFVWGRGAIDNKSSAIALFEAGERLAAANFQPRRTIMFSFGQDAELGGAKGNGEMAKAFAQRGVRFAWVLDEGSPIVNEPYPGVKHPVALLSVAEKGSLALELTAPNQTQLQSALRKVSALSFSSDLDAVQRAKLQVLAPFAPFGDRMKLANVWLLKPMVLGAIETNPQSAAALRTTILETKQPEAKESAGTGMARAVINFRLHQRDTIASVTERVKAAINDAKVEVKPLTEENNEASKAVDVNSPAYRLVAQAIGDTFRIPVAPELMNDRTDSRHYLDNADAVLRFRPFAVEPGDLERVKGANERIAVADLGAAAGFYLRLIQNSQ